MHIHVIKIYVYLLQVLLCRSVINMFICSVLCSAKTESGIFSYIFSVNYFVQIFILNFILSSYDSWVEIIHSV